MSSRVVSFARQSSISCFFRLNNSSKLTESIDILLLKIILLQKIGQSERLLIEPLAHRTRSLFVERSDEFHQCLECRLDGDFVLFAVVGGDNLFEMLLVVCAQGFSASSPGIRRTLERRMR